MNGQDYIVQLKLRPHPEGGFYRQTYRCTETFRQQLCLVASRQTADFNGHFYLLSRVIIPVFIELKVTSAGILCGWVL